jgi:hypothetical protein
MHIVRSGVDSLYLAIKGTLPREIIAKLADAKTVAAKAKREIPIELAIGTISALVSMGGAYDGFNYVFDTGELGARYACREASDRPDWNFFVKPHATALLAHGFWPVIAMVRATLTALGGKIIQISLNRIDYAIDVRADEFTPDLDRFIAHPRAKRRPHLSEKDIFYPCPIYTGRGIETVTIGTMPGKQITIYDKTIQARGKRHFHWFEAWGINRDDKTAKIWRVELRFGRDAIKAHLHNDNSDNYDRNDNFVQLRRCISPMILKLLDKIRYVAPDQSHKPASRRERDPLWLLIEDHIKTVDLLGGEGDLSPTQLAEITRDMKIEMHKKLIVGNAAPLAALMELDDPTIEGSLPDIVAEAIDDALPTPSFRRNLKHARERHGINSNDRNKENV